MEKKETKVVMIHPGTGEIHKVTYPRKGFASKVVYELEDGRKVECNERAEKKKDLVAELATLPKAPKYPTYLEEHDGYHMVRTEYGILSSGLSAP